MLPAARAAAAITVLDRILAGEPAEKALTAWGRGARYAGSGDRAAVRDMVFDALRRRRSAAALGGGDTGRGLVLGLLRANDTAGGDDSATRLFDGSAHGPAVIGPSDATRIPTGAEALDLPDWLMPLLTRALGDDLSAVAHAMQERAPVFLRVNRSKSSRDAAATLLLGEGIETRPHPLANAALEITKGARRLQQGAAYAAGLVELQDVASQAVVEALPLTKSARVLDHCAGGGGKTLAMAARMGGATPDIWAHDTNPRRMEDLKTRAARAGIEVHLTDNPEAEAPYDLILTDVPCSGSGSWRRDPEGKWRLTPARLAELNEIQSSILDRAAEMVAPAGILAYATCSFLCEENEDRIAAFLASHRAWRQISARRFGPLEGGDGFFVALLSKSDPGA